MHLTVSEWPSGCFCVQRNLRKEEVDMTTPNLTWPHRNCFANGCGAPRHIGSDGTRYTFCQTHLRQFAVGPYARGHCEGNHHVISMQGPIRYRDREARRVKRVIEAADKLRPVLTREPIPKKNTLRCGSPSGTLSKHSWRSEKQLFWQAFKLGGGS